MQSLRYFLKSGANLRLESPKIREMPAKTEKDATNPCEKKKREYQMQSHS